jgi:predicted RecB family nuclease
MKQFEHTESSITGDIVATYGQCSRKAYYSLFFPKMRRVKAIATFINQRKKENKVSFIEKSASNSPFCSDQLSGKADIITDATLSYKDQTFENIHLRKINGTSPLGNFLYEPILFTAEIAIKLHDRIRAALCDTVLHGIQATSTGKSTAVLIDGSVRRIAIKREACVTIVEDLRHWINTRPDTPPAGFNKHCPFCAFEHACVEHEKKTDSLSLLSKMPIKLQKKYEAKGIFTIKQLSYLYKPRRRKRRSKQPVLTHKYELQALALKSGTIYTDDLAPPPRETVELYLDIESLPERRFHYLIGVLVSTPDVDQYIPMKKTPGLGFLTLSNNILMRRFFTMEVMRKM